MSIILELRNRVSHAGATLVHKTSEHVVLGSVFGIIKNMSFDAVLNPWLRGLIGDGAIASDEWQFSFWERQPRPTGVQEGSTEVDLVLRSPQMLLFVEVKMDAAPSSGTTHDPERNQLVRNLDIGNGLARHEERGFALVYVTPDVCEPEIVGRIRSEDHPFPTKSLFWSPWSKIADVLANSYREKRLHAVEQSFALDLLAYLAGKALWQNTLEDDPFFYQDKLYRPLRKQDSPFVPYAEQRAERDESWRQNNWDSASLSTLLDSLRWEDKQLLKILAEAGGRLRQGIIMKSIPNLVGKTSASLRALKSRVNAACKGCGKAPILSVGSGAGSNRVHEINPALGEELKNLVIERAKKYEIPKDLLDLPN